jgi:hypothetical protein
MCTLNEKRKPNDRYLIMISLDHPNVGTRTIHRDDTMQKLHVYDMDMMRKVYVNGKGTAFNIISIIECFDIYVFGEDSDAHVEKWGMVGFSMGAFTTAIAASVGLSDSILIDFTHSYNFEK